MILFPFALKTRMFLLHASARKILPAESTAIAFGFAACNTITEKCPLQFKNAKMKGNKEKGEMQREKNKRKEEEKDIKVIVTIQRVLRRRNKR